MINYNYLLTIKTIFFHLYNQNNLLLSLLFHYHHSFSLRNFTNSHRIQLSLYFNKKATNVIVPLNHTHGFLQYAYALQHEEGFIVRLKHFHTKPFVKAYEKSFILITRKKINLIIQLIENLIF